LHGRSQQDSGVTIDNGASGEASPRVILFRPRAKATSPAPQPAASGGPALASPVSDLAKFERSVGRDDYRHRMVVNAIALAFTVLLAAAGIWIAESMAVMRKNQDCALMGRRNCSPVEVPATDRWSESLSRQQR
jgi:hypothetical protein